MLVTTKLQCSVYKSFKRKNKFEKLSGNYYADNIVNTHKISVVKDVVLNLCDDEIPPHHKSLLELGPKFVPTQAAIPYMDIITKTESSALLLQYNKQKVEAENLRQDVLRALKMTKPPKSNLTREQQRALKEIKQDENRSIYPFDKGSGTRNN